ncbi:dynein axonemal assembly factor 11-like [Hoplias malabaricus]|uniref:dynein axonemal assembly factor 11-like n=1 Tax=Hoplias malabaricus TaxID=27720 RepID=UPI0034630CAF
MVRISEDLIRRRAEHNNGEIFSLEEVSLHQQEIERIEHIDKWCRDLRILYLQNNLIPKIENVGRLKKLEYLNLALNNIEVIENLHGCESLQKLDLTVNFVGCLSSVESLKHNVFLRELFLVGNPCSEFQGYRDYVVASLPQLQCLDGTSIGRAERIRALQNLDELRKSILQQERQYLEKREEQKKTGDNLDPDDFRSRTSFSVEDKENKEHVSFTNLDLKQDQNPDINKHTEDQDREFWEKPCAFSPESRLEAHRHLEEKRRMKEGQRDMKTETKAPRTLITAEGKVLNVNEAKLDFNVTEDEDNNCVLLDLHVYRYLDTSLLDVDIQPTYVRVTIKGKVFQLVLPAEVKPDSSTAKRSQTTGHLLLTMPQAHGEIKVKKTAPKASTVNSSKKNSEEKAKGISACERLEVDPSRGSTVVLSNIVPRENYITHGPLQFSHGALEKPVSKGFVDDPEVPPLI